MAATSTSYTSDGVTANYAVGFSYTSRSFVKVYIGGVLSGSWNWLNSTTIHLTVVPANGTSIVITRVTSTTPLVDFVSAATITESDLDTAIGQCLDLLEENQNNSLVGMQQSGGNWDATSDRIINVATPLAGTDAANKTYVDSTAGSAAAAAASAAAAATSESNALTYAGDALSSANDAANEAAAALATANSISSVYPISGMTANYVLKAAGAADVDAVRAELKQFISSAAMSGASAIVALTGGYSEYEIVLEDFQPATNNVALVANFSIDNGATYKTGAADYAWIVNGANSGGAANSGSNTDNQIVLTPVALPSAAPKSRRLSMRLSMGDGTLNNFLSGSGGVQRNGGGHTAIVFSGEMIGFATRATHIKFLFSLGNINAGNVLLYGITR